MADEVEIPIQRCLYRQSSVETRLTPSVPSEGESDESSDEESPPKVVHVVKKPEVKHEVEENPKVLKQRSEFRRKSLEGLFEKRIQQYNDGNETVTVIMRFVTSCAAVI